MSDEKGGEARRDEGGRAWQWESFDELREWVDGAEERREALYERIGYSGGRCDG